MAHYLMLKNSIHRTGTTSFGIARKAFCFLKLENVFVYFFGLCELFQLFFLNDLFIN